MEFGISRSPLRPEKYQDLRPQSRERIQNYILHTARARRQKALMPLIETGYDSRAQNRNGCPAKGPFRIIHRRQHKLSACALQFMELLQQPDMTPAAGRPKLSIFASGAAAQPRGKEASRGRNGTPRASKRTV